jgi:hypothetical protein
MEFRTELTTKGSQRKIDLNDLTITIGSCFSDDIGERLVDYKFSTSKNPLGTVYNPISIHKLLLHAIRKSSPSASGFIERDGSFLHHDFHSAWYSQSQEDLGNRLIQELQKVHETIKNSKHLIITYGTSWVYEEKKSTEVVSNCHKVPQGNFTKFLLTQKRMVESFEDLYKELKSLNKGVRIILTVSPVRHIKDTIALNSVSKSILRLTCHTLQEIYSDVEYFPSYEIMMDDLRDYRFYKPDLIHPTEVAIDYIWEKFGETYFDKATLKFIIEWSEIKSAINHRPFQLNTAAHQRFLKATLNRLTQLRDKVDVHSEVEQLKNQIL